MPYGCYICVSTDERKMILFLLATFRKSFLSFIILLSSAGVAFAQAKFSANANEKIIGLNDFVQIQFKVENANSVAKIDPPSFKNFKVISGPNQERGMTSINGSVSNYAAISFILKPEKAGTFTIPPGFAIADGRQIKSNPVTIRVENKNNVAGAQTAPPVAPPPPADLTPHTHLIDDYILKPGEDPAEKIKRNLFIRMEANKTKCFVGEPIVVSFKLYTRLRSESNVTDAPAFNGFSVNDMNVDNNDASEVKLNGRNFNCYTLRKVQLYPLQAGSFTLSPLRTTNTVTFVKYERNTYRGNDLMMQMMQSLGGDPFGTSDVIQKQIDLSSNTVTVEVKPLPSDNIPSDFRGAVGKFSIQSNLTKENFSTDDAGNLSIVVSGAGNMNLINTPSVSWPQNIDSYDARIKDAIDKQQIPFSGSKTFNIPFSVSKAGNYSIPPIHFSWFDPIEGQYESAKTEPIYFHVSQGKGFQKTASEGISKIAGLITVTQAEWITGTILIGGVLALLFFYLIKKNKKEDELKTQIQLDDLKNQDKKEFEIPGNPLESVHDRLVAEDAEGFYTELKKSVQEYLSGKLKIPAYELSKESILQKMDECNVSIGTSKLLESLMQEIEMGLYAKHSHPGQMRELYDNASELVSLLNKQIC